MKRLWIFIICAIITNCIQAQTDVALDPEFGARVALGLDKKITKGFHIA